MNIKNIEKIVDAQVHNAFALWVAEKFPQGELVTTLLPLREAFYAGAYAMIARRLAPLPKCGN